MKRFDYPHNLHDIFKKLQENSIKPVIVGGYIRDTLLGIPSKDIDIELYNTDSLQKVENILQEFGTLNSVGKSFGVLKLHYKDLDIDFSLPRTESKTSKGHRGFHIRTESSLDFTQAARRRDFTMNAIGYDIETKSLLDPYSGVDAIKREEIVAVDLQTFQEDPLRILRAAVFRARFLFDIEENLLLTMQKMVHRYELSELSKERIYEEFKKIFLKAKKPSLAFLLLHDIDAFEYYFFELHELSQKELHTTLETLDRFALIKEEAQDQKEVIIIMLALLIRFIKEKEHFLQRLTNTKKIITDVLDLDSLLFTQNTIDDYTIYKIAQKVSIKRYTLYLKALKRDTQQLQKRSRELNVYEGALEPLVKGKDLIELGLQPSPEFKNILQEYYEKQMRGEIVSKEEALQKIQQNT